MPSLILPQVPSGLSLEELSDIVAKLSKEIEWIGNGFLDSKNIRNIAGFNVGNTELKHISSIVGMSGANPGTATAVRFWAGHATPTSAPFQVLQDGTIKSTKGFIGGFVIGTNQLTDTAGSMGFDSAITAGDDVRIWAGGTTPSTAPFRVTESGAVNASNITITGGSISVATDVTVGNKIIMNGASFSASLFYKTGIEVYHDPAANTLRLIAPNGVYIEGVRIATDKADKSSITGTVYVASTSGGAATTAISFTSGVRTS